MADLPERFKDLMKVVVCERIGKVGNVYRGLRRTKTAAHPQHQVSKQHHLHLFVHPALYAAERTWRPRLPECSVEVTALNGNCSVPSPNQHLAIPVAAEEKPGCFEKSLSRHFHLSHSVQVSHKHLILSSSTILSPNALGFVMSTLRALPSLAKQYVMRILFVDAVPRAVADSWIMTAHKSLHETALAKLQELCLLDMGAEPETEEVHIWLNPEFRACLQHALTTS